VKATRTCTIDGCQKPVIARGWCTAHWTRWKRHGDPLGGGIDRTPAPDTCVVDECDSPPFARGLCAMDWRRWRAETDPEWQEDFLAKRRDWHAANPDKVQDARRRSRGKHLEAALERARRWRAENRDQVMVNNWRRRRRAAGLSEDVTDVVDPIVIFERDAGICSVCALDVNPDLDWPDPMSATVDHIVPVSDPASEHSYANTALAHFDCNRRKHTNQSARLPRPERMGVPLRDSSCNCPETGQDGHPASTPIKVTGQ